MFVMPPAFDPVCEVPQDAEKLIPAASHEKRPVVKEN